MGFFSQLREALHSERARREEYIKRHPWQHETVNPTMRLLAQTFVMGVATSANVSFDEVRGRFNGLPAYNLNLLDSPASWISLAQQMGFPPRVTVH